MNRAQRRKAGIKIGDPDSGEGGLQIHMAPRGNQVIIEFGTKLKWFAMDRPAAEEFINNLQTQLENLGKEEK